jgi:hypothetical protein
MNPADRVKAREIVLKWLSGLCDEPPAWHADLVEMLAAALTEARKDALAALDAEGER